MKTPYANKLAMSHVVIGTLEKFEAVYSELPAFVKASEDLTELVDRIDKLGQTQTTKSGNTAARQRCGICIQYHHCDDHGWEEGGISFRSAQTSPALLLWFCRSHCRWDVPAGTPASRGTIFQVSHILHQLFTVWSILNST